MNKELENIRGPGRPKGSPNARTQDLFEITDRLECNPFEVLILFAKGDAKALDLPEVPAEMRLRAAKDACDYLFPKRKSIEHIEKPTNILDELFATINVDPTLRAKKLSQSTVAGNWKDFQGNTSMGLEDEKVR